MSFMFYECAMCVSVCAYMYMSVNVDHKITSSVGRGASASVSTVQVSAST